MATKVKAQPSKATETPRETLVERVRKLQDLADGNANVEESALAAAKAAEIALAYHIEQAEIDATRTQAIKREFVGEFVANVRMRAEQQLLLVVADALFGKVVVHRMGANQLYGEVIGWPETVAVTKYLYVYLIRQIDRLQFQEWKKLPAGTIGRSKHCHGFRLGAIDEIRRRLVEQREAAEQKPETGEQTRALIVNTQAELDAAVAAKYPKLRKGKSAKGVSVDAGAYLAGVDAGARIPLRDAIEDGKAGAAPKQLGKRAGGLRAVK